MCVCVIPYVNCFGRTVLYVYTEYCIQVNMYHVSAQDVDERMINVHYYYYLLRLCPQKQNKIYVLCFVRNGPPTLDSSLAGIVVFQRCGLWTLSMNLSPFHYVEAEVFLTSKETVDLIGTGAQDGHLDCHIAPELCFSVTIRLCCSTLYVGAACIRPLQTEA